MQSLQISSKKSDPLNYAQITLKPSRCLACFRVATIAFALLAVISGALPLAFTLPLCLGLIVFAALSYKEQGSSRRKLVGLSCTNSLIWYQIFQDGSRQQAKLIGHYRTRWLVILELQALVTLVKFRVPLPKDSMSADDYAKLCIKLWRG